MNCPRCSGKMEEKEKLTIKHELDGSGTPNGTQKVWFCRDCKATALIKPNSNNR